MLWCPKTNPDSFKISVSIYTNTPTNLLKSALSAAKSQYKIYRVVKEKILHNNLLQLHQFYTVSDI
jgi:hypothetical protein